MSRDSNEFAERLLRAISEDVQAALDTMDPSPPRPAAPGDVVQWVESPEHPGVWTPTEPVRLFNGQSATITWQLIIAITGEQVILPWAEMRIERRESG